ncbi:hypothetical protein BJ508DRAFT_60229 [Ascobolus immersus RN42]|uniref:Myb-like domain-containing protein n=1 Tax=Ascobolus immersus RN42 TaxID=1160509 RepID=A0A3N4IMV4_ASCIM|nr:hypothetical protein BJ508DRAFT_60229 [Ascobolus immersus RN42]
MAELASPPSVTPLSKAAGTPTSKGRKGSAAGGGKAWTEEEEIYLLEMRLNKLPYKKIASHLDKTELACRLHYHQLSHGNSRRKRTNSVSSNTSDKSASSPLATSEMDLSTPAATSSLSTSASGISSVLAAGRKGANLSSVASGAVKKAGSTKVKGKLLFPKPGATSGHGTLPRGRQSGKGTPLRVNCAIENIDKEKLLQIVEAQRQKFWESVAAAYGGTFAPDFLEQAYNDEAASTPPTPARSPAASIKSAASIIDDSLLDTRFSAGSPEITEIPEEVEPEAMDLSDNNVEVVKAEEQVNDAQQEEPIVSESTPLTA